MLEFSRCDVAVIGCYADPATLETLSAPPEMLFRVAEDEAMLIGPLPAAGALLAQVRSRLEEAGGIGVDQTDAWAVFVLRGPGLRQAFHRLVDAALPEASSGFLQCSVAHVPGKVVLLGDRMYLFVPSPVGHHLREQLLECCRDLGGAERQTRAFEVDERALA